jgi:hypothetical protein
MTTYIRRKTMTPPPPPDDYIDPTIRQLAAALIAVHAARPTIDDVEDSLAAALIDATRFSERVVADMLEVLQEVERLLDLTWD